MKNLNPAQIWYVTGSQHLYGPEALKKVADNSRTIVNELKASKEFPLEIVHKGVLATPEEIRNHCQQANSSNDCAGLILWMHTFSPAKMWIGGLSNLKKP